jgi:carbon-monoxide dehydrogenase small subunit
MLMTTSGLLNENPTPTKQDIKDAIEGNICRCTGYNSIVRAVERVAKGMYKEESL